jgi:hypothetical protein
LKHLHPQMGPLLQVMPWPTYADMSPRQVRAIYEYLSAIPSIPLLPSARATIGSVSPGDEKFLHRNVRLPDERARFREGDRNAAQ